MRDLMHVGVEPSLNMDVLPKKGGTPFVPRPTRLYSLLARRVHSPILGNLSWLRFCRKCTSWLRQPEASAGTVAFWNILVRPCQAYNVALLDHIIP